MGFSALLLSNIKMHLRNRSSLFWHFVFPLIFMVLFGLMFKEGGGNITVGLASDKSELASIFEKALKENENIKLVKGTRTELRDKLKKGDLNTVVVMKRESQSKTDVEVLYDPSETFASGIAQSVITGTLNEITKRTFKVPEIFDIKRTSVATESLSYISFLMPGVIGMSIMFSALFATAYALVMEREKGILRRLRLTLLKPSSFLAAKSIGIIAICFMQAAVIIMVGIWGFDVKLVGSLAEGFVIVLLGCVMMVSLGFVIAGIAKNLDSVDAVSNSVGMPMMFLAGTFFPVDQAPSWLRGFAKLLPLTYLNESLREILVKGSSLSEIRGSALMLLGWTLIFLLIAIRTFRWESNRAGKK